MTGRRPAGCDTRSTARSGRRLPSRPPTRQVGGAATWRGRRLPGGAATRPPSRPRGGAVAGLARRFLRGLFRGNPTGIVRGLCAGLPSGLCGGSAGGGLGRVRVAREYILRVGVHRCAHHPALGIDHRQREHRLRTGPCHTPQDSQTVRQAGSIELANYLVTVSYSNIPFRTRYRTYRTLLT